MTMPNFQFKCPHCNHSIAATVEMLGQLIECPSCSQTVEVQKSPVKLPPPPPPHPRTVPKLKMPMPPPTARKASGAKEYKVVTQKELRFDGPFDPEKLEQALNAYAAQGWRVISVTTVPVPVEAGGHREEMIVVIGRDK